jgi:hypothetical protein
LVRPGYYGVPPPNVKTLKESFRRPVPHRLNGRE